MPEPRPQTFDQIVNSLCTASSDLAALVAEGLPEMAGRELDRRDLKLREIAEIIQGVRNKIDPAKHEIIAISLGRPDALSRFFAFSFVEREPSPLEEIRDGRFFGSGVYAIYYKGEDITPYLPIANTETPIYVGKAVPENRTAESAYDQGTVLWRRLKEHRNSMVAGGLNPADFQYRHAIIQSGMEGAVEDFMIRLFKPIWNKELKICYGIGKHGDAATTRGNRRSPWDTMHPGRRWAEATREDQASRENIILRIAGHFAAEPPIANKTELYGLLSLH